MGIGIPESNTLYRAVLQPRRLLLWIYIGRVLVASANFAWALVGALFTSPPVILLAAGVFVSSMGFSAYGFVRSEVRRAPLTSGFLYLQFVHDLLLITAVVHITGGADSQFAALYILAYAAAALLLPIGSSLLLAILGSVLYIGDAVLVSGGDIPVATLLQLVVFVCVALGTGYIAARLQHAGEGREALEEELARVQLRAADILANIQSAILTVDDRGRLLYANPSASALLGLPLQAMVGEPILDALADRASSVVDAVRGHIDGGRSSERASATLVLDGRRIPLAVTTTSISGDLRQIGGATTVIIQDVSDERRLEALRTRTERLQAVAELSASLAHEIKNPLASIRSAVEQIARRPAATADEQTLADLIVRESDRLSRVLTEFLDFARVPDGDIALLDLRAVVHGAATLAATHPDRRPDTALTLALGDEPCEVYGDEDSLHRIVFNLVLNACQATVQPGGEVRVSLRSVAQAERPTGVPTGGSTIAVEVADQGTGIPPELLDRVFEPFITTKPNGNGLGLAVVHRAVEANRGVILVDSDATGTRFTVYLPAARPVLGASQ